MTYWKRFWGHLSTVLRHKWYVFKNCCKAGIVWRGIIHDMSKFSPTEFFESVEYYQGNDSPINACKKDKGISYAWMHHKGRNSHHYEYWTDYYDTGTIAQKMPYEDAIEMVCDYIAAGMAYSYNAKKKFSYKDELKWWEEKKKSNPKMNTHTFLFVDKMMTTMAEEESNNCLKQDKSKYFYEILEDVIKMEERNKTKNV